MFRAFAFCVLIVLLCLCSSAVRADDVKPEDCGKSEENLHKCIDNLVTELKDMKSGAESKALIVKQRFGNDHAKTDPLKQSYESARASIKTTIDMMKKSHPDFTNIKLQFDTAKIRYSQFSTATTTALGQAENPAGFGIFDFFIDFGCAALKLPPQLCSLVKTIVHNIQFNQIKWKDWNSIH